LSFPFGAVPAPEEADLSAAASAEADRGDADRAGPRLRERVVGLSFGVLVVLGTAGNSCEAITL